MNTITKNAVDTSVLPIKIEFGGKTKREDWDCFQWNVTIKTKAGFWNLPYYCGMAYVQTRKDAGKNPFPRNTISAEQWNNANMLPKKPSADDILASLILDASAADENFSDWCSNYGYSDDSIKALTTYQECCKTATLLRKHFGREVIAQLTEQLRDH